MAIFTISSSQTWATFRAGAGSSFTHNDDLVINQGITFTIDTCPDRIIGQVTGNGTYVIDGTVNDIGYIGARSEEINVNGTGALTITGKWKSLGTTDGTSNQNISKPAVPAGGIGYMTYLPGLWIETGRRISFDNENTAPTSGQDTYTPQIKDFVCKQSDPTKPFGQIKAIGADYIVIDHIYTGTVVDNDGICIVKDTKTWTLDRGFALAWTADVNGAHIHESGVYTRWHNAKGFNKTISDYGIGWGCNCFTFDYGDTHIVLPDGTNGNLPPNGCDIRIPNVYFGTSDASFIAESNEQAIYTSYNIETQNSGDVSIDYTVLNVYFMDYGANTFTAQHVAAWFGIGSHNCANPQTFDDIILSNKAGNNQNGPQYPVDCPQQYIYTNSTFASQQDATYAQDAELCNDIAFDNCEWIGHAQEGNGGMPFIATNSPQVTVKNSILVGPNNAITGADDVHIENIVLRPATEAATGLDRSIAFNRCKGGIITNIYDGSESGQGYTAEVILLSDCKNLRVRNIGLHDYQFDLKSLCNDAITARGLSSDINIARCYFKNASDTATAFVDTQGNGITYQDSAFSLTEGLNKECSNLSFNNMGGDIDESQYNTYTDNRFLVYNAGAAGQHQTYGRYSTTKGVIYNLGCHASVGNESHISATNMIFEKNGKCSGVNGSELIIYGQHLIRGITSFDGEWQESNGTGTAGRGNRDFSHINVEYRIDGGTWKAVSSITLTGEVLPISGFILDIKLTWNGSETFICHGLYYNTTDTAQKENLLPIDQESYNLKLTGIITGSEVRVYDNEDGSATTSLGTELAGVESFGGGDFIYTHTGALNTVIIQVMHADYEEYIFPLPVTNKDTAFPIIQKADDND